jgi:hypothetical protein
VSNLFLDSPLEEFPRQQEKHRVRVRLVACGSTVFLYWPEGGPGFCGLSQEEVRKGVLEEDPMVLMHGIYHQITREKFEREVSAGEPFKFVADPAEDAGGRK